jgi:hypothetical protein
MAHGSAVFAEHAGSGLQIAALLKAGADDTALAAAAVPMVCSRLIGGKDIPRDVVVSARSVLNGPKDLLRYNAGVMITSASVAAARMTAMLMQHRHFHACKPMHASRIVHACKSI